MKQQDNILFHENTCIKPIIEQRDNTKRKHQDQRQHQQKIEQRQGKQRSE